MRSTSDGKDTIGGYDEAVPTRRVNTRDSWAGSARLGYRFAPHFRAELEGGYRDNPLSSVTGGGAEPVQGLCNIHSAGGWAAAGRTASSTPGR